MTEPELEGKASRREFFEKKVVKVAPSPRKPARTMTRRILPFGEEGKQLTTHSGGTGKNYLKYISPLTTRIPAKPSIASAHPDQFTLRS